MGAWVTLRTRSSVAATASRSRIAGRHGSRTTSATLAAACAALSDPARGGAVLVGALLVACQQGPATPETGPRGHLDSLLTTKPRLVLSTDKERRRLRTIALVVRKGGSGKSTLATALAVQHERAGGRAVVVDLDPQGSATAWGALGEADRPVVVAVKRDGCNTYSMPRATAAPT